MRVMDDSPIGCIFALAPTRLTRGRQSYSVHKCDAARGTTMPTTLPGRLRARIRQLGMTAADVATLADVNRSFIYDIIRARSGKPSLERLERVAKVLKVDCDWLLHGVGHVEGRLPFADRPDDEFIAIAHAAARPSMGGGAIVEDEEPARTRLPFPAGRGSATSSGRRPPCCACCRSRATACCRRSRTAIPCSWT